MELIVKIGADQQGLQQMISRLKNEFKNLNTSMPGAWSGNAAGMGKYGNILQSGGGAGGGFASSLSGIPVIGELAQKFGGLLGPIGLIGAGFTGLAGIVHQLGNAISQAAADMRTGRITGMSGLMARRWRQAGEAAGVDEGSASGMVNRLQANVGAFNAGDPGAQKLFGEMGINPSGMSTDDLLKAMKGKFGGMKDPSQRARLAKGLFGRGGFEVTELLAKLDAPGEADTEGVNMAAAAGIKKWWRTITRNTGEAAEELWTRYAGAWGKSRLFRWLGVKPMPELKSGVAGEEDAVPVDPAKVAEEAAKEAAQEAARKKGWAAGKSWKWRDGSFHSTRERPEREITEKPGLGFQADSLAQAGLFAGSSLLMNPNLTVAMQSLEVLRLIEVNTGKGSSIFA